MRRERLSELAEAEATLAAHAEELLAKYATMDFSTVKDPAEAQKAFKAKLRETLAKQFDAQKQRRNLELTRIEERVEKLREQITKRNDAREKIIDRRLDQLTNEAEGLGWGQPAGPVTGR